MYLLSVLSVPKPRYKGKLGKKFLILCSKHAMYHGLHPVKYRLVPFYAMLRCCDVFDMTKKNKITIYVSKRCLSSIADSLARNRATSLRFLFNLTFSLLPLNGIFSFFCPTSWVNDSEFPCFAFLIWWLQWATKTRSSVPSFVNYFINNYLAYLLPISPSPFFNTWRWSMFIHLSLILPVILFASSIHG